MHEVVLLFVKRLSVQLHRVRQTTDCRPQTAEWIDKENSINSDVIINNISHANNINLVVKILLDFLWWFTVIMCCSS